MPLIFSPLSEAVIDTAPKVLYPCRGFLMQQLGAPPDIDVRMSRTVAEVLGAAGFQTIDANTTTGAKDYLARIVELIRATGFTIAVFSEQTRPTAMANIALELGFAAMCGKPLVIVKSKAAVAPSDLKRTDWIEFDPDDDGPCRDKLRQAAVELQNLCAWEQQLLEVALEARSMDCAVAFERAQKAFLLSGAAAHIDAAGTILERVNTASEAVSIGDLERLRAEIRAFRSLALATLDGH